MFYIVITSCLLERDFERRKHQYTLGIESVLKRYRDKAKIIIVENNGFRKTFLDDFGIPVLYTTNNQYKSDNKGAKEILDVFAAINYMGVEPDDFVVKFGGRYHVSDDCPFFDHLDEMIKGNTNYDCIAKEINDRDYFSGLIGMRCKYLLNIKVPNGENIELMWANVGKTLSNKLLIPMLGMYICPSGNDFFLY